MTMATRSSKLYDDTTAVRVAIVGAGLMGAQVGCEYALGGHDVVLCARDPDAARARADAGFRLLESHGLRSADEVAAGVAGLSASADPQAAAEGTDLVVDSLPEDIELKSRVLRAALGAAPDATVATNTSSLAIAVLGKRSAGRSERSGRTT